MTAYDEAGRAAARINTDLAAEVAAASRPTPQEMDRWERDGAAKLLAMLAEDAEQRATRDAVLAATVGSLLGLLLAVVAVTALARALGGARRG